MNIKDTGDVIGKASLPAFPMVFNQIQLRILPKIEEVFDKNLIPTYNYSRIYYDGSILKKHVDRYACEYSITINLYQEKGIWPIYMKDGDKEATEISLEPGDAAWYKGIEVLHWRKKNTNGIGYQTFMHFVEKNGKHMNEVYENEILWNEGLNNPMYQFDF
jgi:hypothetical protein